MTYHNTPENHIVRANTGAVITPSNCFIPKKNDSFCFVADPLWPGGTMSLVSDVKMVTALQLVVDLTMELCQIHVTIAVNVTWISCLYHYSLLTPDLGRSCIS